MLDMNTTSGAPGMAGIPGIAGVSSMPGTSHVVTPCKTGSINQSALKWLRCHLYSGYPSQRLTSPIQWIHLVVQLWQGQLPFRGGLEEARLGVREALDLALKIQFQTCLYSSEKWAFSRKTDLFFAFIISPLSFLSE